MCIQGAWPFGGISASAVYLYFSVGASQAYMF